MNENSLFDLTLEDGYISSLSAKLTAYDGLFSILNKKISFDDFIREVLVVSMKVLPCEAGSILELDYKHNDLFFRTAIGSVADKLKIYRIPVGVGAAGFVAQTLNPLNLTNAAENKIHLKSISNSVGFEVKSMICAPIVIKGKLYGVIELINRVGETQFTEEDTSILMDFTNKVSFVIENRIRLLSLEKTIRDSQK